MPRLWIRTGFDLPFRIFLGTHSATCAGRRSRISPGRVSRQLAHCPELEHLSADLSRVIDLPFSDRERIREVLPFELDGIILKSRYRIEGPAQRLAIGYGIGISCVDEFAVIDKLLVYFNMAKPDAGRSSASGWPG